MSDSFEKGITTKIAEFIEFGFIEHACGAWVDLISRSKGGVAQGYRRGEIGPFQTY